MRVIRETESSVRDQVHAVRHALVVRSRADWHQHDSDGAILPVVEQRL